MQQAESRRGVIPMKDDTGVIDLVTRARNRDKQAWNDLVER